MFRLQWTRPYRRGWFGILLILLILGGTAFSVGIIVSAASGGSTHRGVSATELLAGILLLIIWVGGLARVALMGIYVSDVGLRYRGLLHTATVPWAKVRAVRLGPLNMRFLGEATGAEAIWIDCSDRGSLATWVNDRGIDFLGRRAAFERAFSSIALAVDSHR
jgi:hypothetical protein